MCVCNNITYKPIKRDITAFSQWRGQWAVIILKIAGFKSIVITHRPDFSFSAIKLIKCSFTHFQIKITLFI